MHEQSPQVSGHVDATRHTGRRAVVTGAGSGIGRAIVLRLAREGAHVTAVDIDLAGLAETERLLEPPTQQQVDVRRVDVTVQADVDRLVAALVNVDILVNNAGIMDHFLPLDEVDDATWDKVLAVNLTGVMRLTRAVLPGMRKAHAGAIVTVASEASLRAGAAGAAYTSSKHGVIGLVKHVAFFYGPDGIRSNAVLPGGVATGIGTSASPGSQWAIQRAGAAMAAMGPIADPDQIAAAVSWLASDEAANVNGALMTDDGGWSAA
ncbi:MAG: SDR family NAD(P)-dependent oxidoreductase [Candidatus Nanopelagicales bacterium]